MKCQSYLPHLPLYNSTSNLEVCNSWMKGESLKKAKLKLCKLLLFTYFILFIEEIDRSPVLPETFCQKKRSYSKITEKRTFYPKITEKRTFWPKKRKKNEILELKKTDFVLWNEFWQHCIQSSTVVGICVFWRFCENVRWNRLFFVKKVAIYEIWQ